MSADGLIGAPIWTHDKRGGDLIIAGVREFKGVRFLDVRLWTNGGTTPTKKGTTIPLDAVPSLARALSAHVAAIPAGGPENGS